MTCHAFNIEDAKQYGVDSAIILHNIRFWLDHNKANGSHINDGYVWTYNSARAFSELFPYWSSNKIQKLLKKLESDGVIITGNYNKAGYDKTKWYTLPEYSLKPNGGMDSAKLNNQSSRIAEPIPDINTHVITDEINTDISHPEKRLYFINELPKSLFHHCHEMIGRLNLLNSVNGLKYFTGKLDLSEWQECESQMDSCDCFDYAGYAYWWHENHYHSMRKQPSLPNMLTDMNGIPFDQFYDSTFLQEWD